MDISKLLDLNIIGKFKYLSSLMNMDVSSNNDVTVINSAIDSDMFNIICNTKNSSGLKWAIEKFQSLKLSFACWVGFNFDYCSCKQDLESMGFVCDEHEMAMFAEIEKISREKKCCKLQISLIDDAQKLNDFIKIYQELIPHDSNQIKEFYKRAEKHILSPESSLKLFIGYLNDKPIATSALFIDENTAGVWDITTLEEFRRKGIGTDMTLHALFYAYDNFGHKIGVLTASELGERVYKKIGFQKLKNFYVFNVKGKFEEL